jgi:hypothetical protein
VEASETASRGKRQLMSWWRLGAGAGAVGVPGAIGFVSPIAAVALALIEVTLPMLVIVVVGSVAVFGSDRASERMFRLLRLVTDRAEPPATFLTPRPPSRT